MSTLTTTKTSVHHEESHTLFGFWVYIMTDCVLFATLFATYIVLQPNTAGGPGAFELFDLNTALTETIILLISSFVCGLALIAVHARRASLAIGLFILTFILGASFLAIELTEFSHLAAEGNSWQRSGFLSSFFTLVGTHGLHITFGLLWILTMLVQIFIKGFTEPVVRRLTTLALFWHFLDVIWIFIFTIVYLTGGLSS